LTLLHKPNGGQSSARNLGVRQSKSDLIAFLDQDDLWYDNHLEELVKPFLVPTEPVLGWVYSDLDEIDQNGFLICRSFLSTIPVVQPKRHIFDCIRQNMYILPSASLICRKAFEAGL
jgi:glycosyltransferase involved in cell wall biosynthesis